MLLSILLCCQLLQSSWEGFIWFIGVATSPYFKDQRIYVSIWSCLLPPYAAQCPPYNHVNVIAQKALGGLFSNLAHAFEVIVLRVRKFGKVMDVNQGYSVRKKIWFFLSKFSLLKMFLKINLWIYHGSAPWWVVFDISSIFSKFRNLDFGWILACFCLGLALLTLS